MSKVISKIETQKRKGRYNVYVNDKYAFPISESVMIKFRVFKGMELTDDLIAELTKADEVSKAYNRALDYIASQLRSEKEVSDKLLGIDISPEVIEQVLKKLREQNFVDDTNYAESYVHTQVRLETKGPRTITTHLRQKGIGEIDIEKGLQDYPEEVQVENGLKLGQKLAKRYEKNPLSMMNQKIRQGLMSNGFGGDVVTQIMSELEVKPDMDKQAELLQKQGEKSWHHFRGEREGTRIMKTKQALFRKGFTMEDINGLIEKLISSGD